MNEPTNNPPPNNPAPKPSVIDFMVNEGVKGNAFGERHPQLGEEPIPPKPPEDKPPIPPVPPEKEGEINLDVEEEPPQHLSDKAKANWKSLRNTAKRERDRANTASKELDGIKAEIATLKAKPATADRAAEIEALTKERDELSNEMRLVKIENHPKFKNYFGTKTNQQIEYAKRVVGADNASKVEELLKMPESTYKREGIEALLSDLSPLQQQQLGSAVIELDRINDEKKSEIEKAVKDYDSLSARERAEQEAVQARNKGKIEAIKAEALKVADTYESFKVQDKNDEHNKAVETRKALVENYFSGQLDEKTYAIIPVLAAEAMFLKESRLPALEKENASLKEQLAKMKAARPSMDGAIPTNEGGDMKGSLIDRMVKMGQSNGAFAR